MTNVKTTGQGRIWTLAVAVLLTAGACGTKVEEIALPTSAVASGFVLKTDSFFFPNFGGVSAVASMNPASVARLFGEAAACASVKNDVCLLRPVAKTWMKAVNQSMQGGRCEGFAVLSGLMFLGEMSPKDFGADTVAGLGLKDNTLLAREIAFWYSTQYLQDVVLTGSQQLSAKKTVSFLAEEFAKPLAKQQGWRLGIVRLDDEGRVMGGHAILPYALEPEAVAGKYRLLVYDNNHPELERAILIDTNLNRWEYVASTDPTNSAALYFGDSKNGNPMYLAPVRARTAKHPCPFCTMEEAAGQAALAQVFGFGSAEVSVETPTGKKAGLINGRWVNEIPNARVEPTFSLDPWADPMPPVMLVPRGDVSVTITGRSDGGSAGAIVNGPGFAATAETTFLQGDKGVTHQLDVSGDGTAVRFKPGKAIDGVVTVSHETKSGGQLAVTLTFKAADGVSSVEIAVDIVKGDATLGVKGEGDMNLTIEITKSSKDGEDTLNGTVVNPAGGTVTVDVEHWNGSGTPMPVEIDTDGDGTPDQSSQIEDLGPPEDCANSQKDNSETDIDCGGACTTKCIDGRGCLMADDCVSGFCNATTNVCVATHCDDATKNGGETDKDCAGGCAKKCDAGQVCATDGDCSTGMCNTLTHRCSATACEDGRKDGDETDSDCGGTCGEKCSLGKGCGKGGDCKSGFCNPTTQVCVASHCLDEVVDGDETGMDCGGSCQKKCPLGIGCLVGADCASTFCNAQTLLCVATQCEDGEQDGDETGADCGGACATKCADGQGCQTGADCASTFCHTTNLVCVATECDDGKQNGQETGMDCGGTCATKCAVGQSCVTNADCASVNCSVQNHLCVAGECDNGKQDGEESGVDCGGACVTKCADGVGCMTGGDCASTFCHAQTHLCVQTQCDDGQQNGQETDVDCGGTCATQCTDGQGCASGADCASTFCHAKGHMCVETECDDGVKNGQETGEDCGGGTCPTQCAVGEGCATGADCASTFCNGPSQLCVTTQCDDGKQNGKETGQDCGGPCAAKCAEGNGCQTGADCASTFCHVQTHLCVPTQCDDGEKNGQETGADCGGTCATKCADGLGCAKGTDCASTFCNGTSQVCVATQCDDGELNGDETAADCGGTCATKCADGKGCQAGADCASTFCNGTSQVCVATQCDDGEKNGQETAVDCGGTCGTKCEDGQGCAKGADCKSSLCNAQSQVCVATPCDDGLQNGQETAVDCGGTCATKCALGKGCATGGDCKSTYCNAQSQLCVATQCDDGEQNGQETGEDCGGICATKCADGLGCAKGTDCASTFCNGTSQVCVATQCADGELNGQETAVDCGGICATKCADGKGCQAGADCASTFCNGTSQVCVATQCADGEQNGQETAVDCGGICATKCAGGKGCQAGADCVSTFCNGTSQVCVATQCDDGELNGDETAADCGGSCPTKCANGLGCAAGADCSSAFCNTQDSLCAEPACDDDQVNGDETGLDCGGSCSTKCADGEGCQVATDCASEACHANNLFCVATTCEDGAQDGQETGPDCGGTCAAKCAIGVGCSGAADCQSNACNENTLVCYVPSCSDGAKNGSETGTDCGGPCPTTCPLDGGCSQNADCTSGMCHATTQVCVASLCENGVQDGSETAADCGGLCPACSACQDGVQNGTETDIDCGGSCGACVGSACNSAGDCATGVCIDNVCRNQVGAAQVRPSGVLDNIARFKDNGSFVDLPVAVAAAATVQFGSRVYLLGGYIDGSISNVIYEAVADQDGLVFSFKTVMTTLAVPRAAARAEVIGKYLYVFGGVNDFGQLASVERAVLDSNGIAAAFEVLPITLVTPRQNFQTLVTNGHVYVLGGNYPQLDSIEVAPVNAIGDLTGPFTELVRTAVSGTVVTNGLVQARWTHGLLRLGSDVYILGGEDMASIEKTTIRPDGTLDNFELLTIELAGNRNRPNVIALANKVYVFGGWASQFLTRIDEADIVDGVVGPFTVAGITLSQPVEDASCLLTNSAVYLLGGSAGGAYNYVQRGIILSP
jgi:hypothetical protein